MPGVLPVGQGDYVHAELSAAVNKGGTAGSQLFLWEHATPTAWPGPTAWAHNPARKSLGIFDSMQ